MNNTENIPNIMDNSALIKEKLDKIKDYCKEVLKITYPYCGKIDGELREIVEKTNGEAYKIKCLSEEIEKLI